jgi:hypothetical protein
MAHSVTPQQMSMQGFAPQQLQMKGQQMVRRLHVLLSARSRCLSCLSPAPGCSSARRGAG